MRGVWRNRAAHRQIVRNIPMAWMSLPIELTDLSRRRELGGGVPEMLQPDVMDFARPTNAPAGP